MFRLKKEKFFIILLPIFLLQILVLYANNNFNKIDI